LVTVATYVVVWLRGNVAEPVGKVSCRSSASGSVGEKLIETAFDVVQVRVTSCPATTVPVLAVSETVGAGPGDGGGTVGVGGGTGTGVGGVGKGGRGCVGVPPPPASCDIALEPVPPQPAHSATQIIVVKVMEKLRSLRLPWPITTPCSIRYFGFSYSGESCRSECNQPGFPACKVFWEPSLLWV
jgi:hypothetical protein